MFYVFIRPLIFIKKKKKSIYSFSNLDDEIPDFSQQPWGQQSVFLLNFNFIALHFWFYILYCVVGVFCFSIWLALQPTIA